LGEIFKLIGGYRVSQAIYVVAEIGIPDLLAAGPKNCDQLANETNTHAPTLYRILRFLAGAGLFNEVRPQTFELTRLGSALRTDVPGSGNMTARLLLSEFHWNPWGRLIHSVRTGETAFDYVHGMGVFQYLEKNAEASAVFNAAMTSLSVGRGLISTQPNSDRCEFDERQIVGCELVISGRDTATLLDLIEEPFDAVASTIQMWAEADWVFAISFRRNVCPCPYLSDKLPDPIRIVSTICEQHRLRKQGAEKSRTQPIVVRFAGREREMDRQALAVHYRVNLAR
jgi:methyltransferase family protein